MPANAAFLRDIPLFQNMDDVEREAIAQLMDEARFSAGQQLFHERDVGGICYVLRSGRIELSVEDESKQKLIVDVLEPGELCGELSLLDGGNRSTTATALTDVETLVLERPELIAWLRKQPDASLDVIVALAKRIRRADALLKQRVQNPNEVIAEQITLGDRVADAVASFGGSWKFIITFTVAMIGWMAINLTLAKTAFDPFPFILLNLVLSALAALQAPVIMMSQNRQDAKDRIRSEADYRVNVRSEVEIAELHEKLDKMNGELRLALAALSKKLGPSLVLLALLGGAAHAETAKPITLTVDASEVPRRILHVKESIPVAAGKVTLVYPKWIPGEHGPNGPIADLAGLVIKAGGKTLDWRRDPIDMFAIHVDAPSSPLEVSFDYLGSPDPDGFSNASSMSDQLAVLEWNLVVLSPAGVRARDQRIQPSLTHPKGWKTGTALDFVRGSDTRKEFAATTLETLIDSPVILGAHCKSFPLGGTPEHIVDACADSEGALSPSPKIVEEWKSLVAETGALFGARHYRRYHFLLALSDHVAHFGLEHHQSSDNRQGERYLVDDEVWHGDSTLLSHEFTHSWNGKFRRPEGLATDDASQPMKGELLWVYEGLTNYLGWVLAARMGEPADWIHDQLAETAAMLSHRSGRKWRSIGDTAVAAQKLYGSGPTWANWRRAVDFYPEGTMLWLEVDTIIRRETKGARSLDDFCHKFHGGAQNGPEVKPYSREEVVRTLEEVAHYDWNGFFARRVDAVDPKPPTAGLEAAGWKLVYDDKPNLALKAYEKERKALHFMYSLGFLMKEDGAVLDVVPDEPAARAGLAPGMKLLAVNDRKWNPERLKDAARSSQPVTLTVENGEVFHTLKLTHAAGEHQPHLQRIDGRPDLLGDILRPHH
jgi:predicted metalloprotease with PDZ domain/uncharacterized membrane protein